jgi:SAM-dependent methyltransferase
LISVGIRKTASGRQIVGPRLKSSDRSERRHACAQRRGAPEVAHRIGYRNVSFRKGRIQDLALDLEELDRVLRANPVRSAEDVTRLDGEMARLRQEKPLVAGNSVDVVVSNCVLNLVRPEDKRKLFAEIFRVLRPGGRAVISDIVGDEDVPDRLRRDPELWSGCISGALREDRFLEAFEEAGFYGVTLSERGAEPWRTIEGIAFRSVTVMATEQEGRPCVDGKQVVIYGDPSARFSTTRYVFRRVWDGGLREDVPLLPGALSLHVG